MMMRIRTLDEGFKRTMREHALSDEELKQAADEMKSKQKKAFIAYVIGIIIVSVLMVVAYLVELENSGTPVGLSAAVLTLAVFIVAGYFVSVGIFKIQFNGELKKDYPHLYDECKL